MRREGGATHTWRIHKSREIMSNIKTEVHEMYVCVVLCMCVLCMYACLLLYGCMCTLLAKGFSGEVELSNTASLAINHTWEISCVLSLFTGLKIDNHTHLELKKFWRSQLQSSHLDDSALSTKSNPSSYIWVFSWINFSHSSKLAMWGFRCFCYHCLSTYMCSIV